MFCVLQIPSDLRLQISAALEAFAEVPRERWLRECIICLLTPQSSPVRAEQAMILLESFGIYEGKLSREATAEILRTPAHYVRFHNVKAARVLTLVEQWPALLQFLSKGRSAVEERAFLVSRVNGYGLKEASHALRNIGRRNLAILDRHILRRLTEHGVIENIPSGMSNKKYIAIEEQFRQFAAKTGEEMDVIDLFFWAQGTGFVFK